MWVKCTRCAHTGRDRMTVSVGTRSHFDARGGQTREAETLTLYTSHDTTRASKPGRSVEPDRNRARGVRSIRHSIFARVARALRPRAVWVSYCTR